MQSVFYSVNLSQTCGPAIPSTSQPSSCRHSSRKRALLPSYTCGSSDSFHDVDSTDCRRSSPPPTSATMCDGVRQMNGTLQCNTPRKICRSFGAVQRHDDAEAEEDSDDSDSGLVASLLPAVSSLLTTVRKSDVAAQGCGNQNSTPSPATKTTHGTASPCSVTQTAGLAVPMPHKHLSHAVVPLDHDHPEAKEDLPTHFDMSAAPLPWDAALAPFSLSPQSFMLMNSLPPHDLVRRQHLHFSRALLPPQHESLKRKITLVLDLDETLVHCGFEAIEGADIQLDINYGGAQYRVHGRRRPYLEVFLEEASKHFELICFTASQRLYAEKIVEMIDPAGHIKHTLFRDSCVSVRGNFLKDLSFLGRDLRHTLLLDNSPHAFGFQVANGVPIVSWFDDGNDTELLSTLQWLRSTLIHPDGTPVDDVRPHVREKFRVHEHLAPNRAASAVN